MQKKTGKVSSEKECPRLKGWLRFLLVIIGTISVVLGVLGIILPILPTTPFLLLAAACYGRSSQRFYCWLLNNRFLGKYIENYRSKRGIPLKIKAFTLTLLWVTILLSAILFVDPVLIKILLLLIAAGVTIHILTIKTVN